MTIRDYRLAYRQVNAIRGGTPVLGDLYLQDYHLVFCFQPPTPEGLAPAGPPPRERQGWTAYHLINYCAFRPTPPSSGIPSSIRIRCRDFSFVSFNFTNDKEAREAFEFIKSRTCRLGSIEKLYAFKYEAPPPEKVVKGWDLYDAKAEFRRQGISEKAADRGWRISSINKDYAFSPTYPATLVVPSKISDSTLKYASTFRSRARIPVLTYLHPVNNCTITRSSQPFVGLRGKRSIQDERLVSACFSASRDFSDPLNQAGFEQSPPTSQPDSVESEQEISDTEKAEDDFINNPDYDKSGKRLIYGAQQHNLIVDARPAINSYAMQAIGMGSENMEYYRFAKKVFLSIDNIHVMRDSLNKVIDALKDADVSPFPPNREALAKSNWLKHIAGILDGSAIIARQVAIQHSHALIHCSDGWDRTSQLCALSQIMLDPYYRTMEGFIVLVEKDWLSFGHMFQKRSGYLCHEKWFVTENDALAGSTIKPGENDGRSDAIENAFASAKRFFKGKDQDEAPDLDATVTEEVKSATETMPVIGDHATIPKEISPVFHQFLDATYQLLRQNPTRFEFNERFLRRLLYHLYSCQYGTFLCNNERQRHEARLRERTSSVWDYFLSRRREFTNDSYDPIIDDHTKGRERLIFPRLADVRWWHQVFNRTDDEMNGALNASAATAERVAAYQFQNNPSQTSTPGTPQRTSEASPREGRSPSRSPQPPALSNSQSVLTGVETAHSALTPQPSPDGEQAPSGAAVANTLTALRDGIAGLNIGKGVLGGIGMGRGSGEAPPAALGEQEMKSMD
ncbi:phosphatases II [Coniochaeta ligniaria NRRL 30616]|uniref:Phosphatases II n=1 Tax=Coniochaeta ligniaria NRRL 30616 TaxID=1408157 RepID=A0A1J7JUF4_9PEZI|nr:phosphatases II [Coniochaeta ligniaria NRRL 30616]